MPSVTKRNMSLMLFTIFLTTLLVIKAQLYRKTDSCPSGIVQWRKQEGVFQCPPETPYHCILMYNSSQLYETCIAAVTIGPGKVGCPWILLHQGKPIHGSKNSECPVTNPECPPTNHKGYLSNQLYQYQACFLESSERTSQLKPSTLAEANIPDPNLTSKESTVEVWSIIVPVISIVLIIVAATVVVVVLLRRNKVICRSNQGSGRTKRDENKGSTKTFQDIEQNPVEGQELINKNDCETAENPVTDINLQQSGFKMEFQTSTGKKDFSDEPVETFSEDMVKAVFVTVLGFHNGIAGFFKLLELLIQKDLFSGLKEEDLERLLRCNSTSFRVLEDSEGILFVIAYSPDAEICEKYNTPGRPGECTRNNCRKFHLCLFNLKRICHKWNCKLSHTYTEKHNRQLKETTHFHEYSDNEMDIILLNQYPKACSIPDCKDDDHCPYLHICIKFCDHKCNNGSKCPYGHSFDTEHNAWILTAYGIPARDLMSGCERTRYFSLARNMKQTK